MKKESEPRPTIRQFKLTVKEGGELYDTHSIAESILQNLRKSGLNPDELLFCGYDGSKSPKQSGEVFATGPEGLYTPRDDTQSVIDYASEFEKPRIALYKATHLQHLEIAHEYKITKKDALAGVIAIIYK